MDDDKAVVSLPTLAVTAELGAEMVGRSRTRIFNAIKDNELTARKDGKATLIEVEELRRWVRALPTRGRAPKTADANANVYALAPADAAAIPTAAEGVST